MRNRGVSLVAAICLIAGISHAQSKTAPKTMAGATMPTWAQIEAKIRKQWAESYPQETLKAVTKVGEPAYNDEPGKTETFTSGSSEFDWSDWSFHDNSWTTTIKGREGSYLRQTADVTVERADKTQATFRVAALYKLTSHAWQFAELPVAKVTERAGAGSPKQPSSSEAAALFTAGWKNARPDFNIVGVKVNGSEFHQSKGNVWLTSKIEVAVLGSEKSSAKYKGKKFVCKPADYDSVLKWDAGKSAWMADEHMIQNINEDSACEAQ
jgi:hypothetical protein